MQKRLSLRIGVGVVVWVVERLGVRVGIWDVGEAMAREEMVVDRAKLR